MIKYQVSENLIIQRLLIMCKIDINWRSLPVLVRRPVFNQGLRVSYDFDFVISLEEFNTVSQASASHISKMGSIFMDHIRIMLPYVDWSSSNLLKSSKNSMECDINFIIILYLRIGTSFFCILCSVATK